VVVHSEIIWQNLSTKAITSKTSQRAHGVFSMNGDSRDLGSSNRCLILAKFGHCMRKTYQDSGFILRQKMQMSLSSPRWSGVFPAVLTQMHADQSLNLEACARHFEAQLLAGVSGLIVCGSLGENQCLQPEEKRAVLRCAVETANGRVPVLTGVAEMSTRTAVQYMHDSEKLGAAGFMIMPPMVYKSDPAETEHWFRTLAAATALPWMLYNNPVGYSTDVTPEMFAELADIENLTSIKESSANPRRITEIRNRVGDRYQLFTGVDDLMLECSILGIDGWVAGSGIAFPKENQRLWDLTRQGRWDEARALYRWAQPLMKLDTHLHFVQYIKLLCQETGLGQEWVREPRLPLEGRERDEVLTIIRAALAKRDQLAA
jgi:dihydrodipicolinate synthase/N-acetylneuraminate lyase